MAAKKTAKKTPTNKAAAPAKAGKSPSKKASKKQPKATKPEMSKDDARLNKARSFYAGLLSAADKEAGIQQGEATKMSPISTGCLCADYITGGGVFPGFYEFFGKEGAGKTTLAVGTLANSIKAGVPLNIMRDVEGSLTPDFTDNVLRAFDLSEVFGSGLAKYYDDKLIEVWGQHLKAITRAMPRKVWSDKGKTWCYVVPKGASGKSSKIMLEGLEASGLVVDKKLSTDKLWLFPTPYSGPEAIYITDSLAALVPEDVEDGDVGIGNAAIARSMGAAVPTFAGHLRSRGVVLLGTNQIRTNPRAMFQDPEYTPGGSVLHHAFEVRLKMDSRAVPGGFTKDKDTGYLCIEESVFQKGAVDRYAFKGLGTLKNKFGRPFMKSMARIMVADHTGVGRGIDPVYDAVRFMEDTGQAKMSEGKKPAIVIVPRPSLNKRVQAIAGKPIPFLDFKRLVTAEHWNDRTMMGEALKSLSISKPIHLRDALFEQMRKDSTLWASRSAHSKNAKGGKKASSEDDE